MSDFMTHDGSEFIVAGVEFLDQSRIDRDLAAGHAPGVDLGRIDDADFPFRNFNAPARGRIDRPATAG
jgi:hypothetical protein